MGVCTLGGCASDAGSCGAAGGDDCCTRTAGGNTTRFCSGGNLTCGIGDASPGLCTACGEKDGPCCGSTTGNRSCTAANTECTGAGANSTGTCTACGASGQSCCGGNTGTCSGAALVCRTGTCDPCGAAGETCCGTGMIVNRTCNTGLACTAAEAGGGPNNAKCE